MITPAIPFRLPYGLWRNGHIHREFTLRPIRGADEMALADTESDAPAVEAASLLLDRCITKTGDGCHEQGLAGALTIGDREVLLRRLYALSFGKRVVATFVCPDCRETIALDLDVTEFETAPPEPGPIHICRTETGSIAFRLPTGADQERAARLGGDAAMAIAEACIGGPLRPGSFAVLEERLAEVDPNAETEVSVSCPACRALASAYLDSFELLRAALGGIGAILVDVDRLARAYGWSEADIVALPAARRRRYLALSAQDESPS